MPKRDFNSQAEAYLEKFMDGMRDKEANEMIVLANGYQTVLDNLQSNIDKLSEVEAKSLNELFKEKRFKDFLTQAETQHNIYANNSGNLIATIQAQFAEAGLDTTQGLLTTLTRDFNLLPVDAINNIIGFTADGSPLQEVLLERYGDSYQDVANTLIDAVAEGLNPKETARLIGESLQGNLSDTLRIARTEQMRAFRTASLVQMKESGVVDGWEWIVEPDACQFCESMAGTIFSLDVNMDTHPNCRCIQAPHIGTKDLNTQEDLNTALEDAGLESQKADLKQLAEKMEAGGKVARAISRIKTFEELENVTPLQSVQPKFSIPKLREELLKRKFPGITPKQIKELAIADNVASRFTPNFIKDIIEKAANTPGTTLTLDYFTVVKSLPDINAKYYLERAIENKWTLQELKDAIKKSKKNR